jgi:hypothetical protein
MKIVGFKDVLNGIINFITSLKLIISKEFYTKMYDKHLMYSYMINKIILFIFTYFNIFKGVDLGYKIFILGLIAFIYNWLREVYLEYDFKKQNKHYPFDWKDIYFGSYGGMLSILI